MALIKKECRGYFTGCLANLETWKNLESQGMRFFDLEKPGKSGKSQGFSKVRENGKKVRENGEKPGIS